MERPDVEAAAEPGPGLVAQPSDLELADLVGEGLARPGDVAVDLVDDVVLGQGGVVEHEVDRPLARPAEGVHAGVDDEPAGAPRVERRIPIRSTSPE